MIFGIICGLLSASLMSGSYVFSRAYLRTHKDPIQLAVFSQLHMGLWGLILLAVSAWLVEFPKTGDFFLCLLGETLSFLIAQTCFLMTLREVEASRAGSLMGLKLIALAVITMLMGNFLSLIQWIAVILCTVSAVGMNFSGGKMSLKCVILLMTAMFCYAFCDICITKMMNLMPGENAFMNSFCVMGFTYFSISLFVLPGLLKYPLNKKMMKDSVPYAMFYFLSMIFLMTCFGLLGVVFGSIIQAGRSVISVLLGLVLLRLGLEKNEPDVPLRVWIRRFLMAVLMLSAMVIYTLSVH